MKLNLILSILAITGAFAVENAAEEKKTPEQLRAGLKKRGLQASDGGDNGGDDGSGAGCFSAHTTVEVLGKGTINMMSLEIGDYVRAGKGDFSRVFSFGHRDTDFEEQFLQIYAAGKPEPIELTPNHMLFVNQKPVRADAVKVGDMLDDNEVVDVKSISRTGVFAPITEAGEIYVSGIRASSYVAFVEDIFVDQHRLIHMFFAPHRVLCGVHFSWCENETYTDGFSDYSNWAIQRYMKANTWSAPAKHAAALIALVVLPIWSLPENFFVSPLVSLAMLGFVAYKAKTKKVKSF